ncbi:hypothetical protein, partial [Candidatus Aalborgicola defluviihabitans]|uniref:hypothetical protein n=1 Tax=Candidatus Aalborgicola defluviihabitans TaxID=3386187 RepID=UPI0039B9B800
IQKTLAWWWLRHWRMVVQYREHWSALVWFANGCCGWWVANDVDTLATTLLVVCGYQSKVGSYGAAGPCMDGTDWLGSHWKKMDVALWWLLSGGEPECG